MCACARWSQVYCDERYRDQTERTSRSKWAVTFDERSNPLIECSFTISDVVSDKGAKNSGTLCGAPE